MRARALRRALAVIVVPPVLFVAWLLALWPPPLWYRTHWPSETEFMRQGRCTTAQQPACPPRRYTPLPLERIAPSLVEAVLTAEDARFRAHGGVDWVELRKALGYRGSRFAWSSPADRSELLRALGTARAGRTPTRGASTLTQQLARNLYLSPSRNPFRKLKEAVTAWRLERALGKDRILELYLNVAELGVEVWGVEAASRRYYGTGADRLTLTQSAALAATLPFPRSSNPAFRPARMRRRQDLILRRMRGERIEVPKVEEESVPQPGDSIQWTPGVDSLLDSLRAPVETLYERPPDPAPQSTSRNGITRVR